MAAVLACGDGAALSHRNAAQFWTMLPHPARTGPVDVTVRSGDPRGKPGIRLHRNSGLSRAEIRIRHGIPVTSPPRTLLDLAATSPNDLEQAFAEDRAKRLVSDNDLTALVANHRRHRGIKLLRAILEDGPRLTRSEAERRFLALVRRARLPPPEVNVRIGPYEVDFLWRRHRLLVEVDGYAFHSSRAAFERDRRRDAELMADGFKVLRITWRRIVDEPEALVACLAQALARVG
jgi:very-short-patch-repair endonuclease